MTEPLDPLKDLWQSQAPTVPPVTMETIYRLDRKLRRSVDTRNLREWVACAFVLVAFGRTALRTESLWTGLGAAVLALASIYIAWRLYQDGRIRKAKPNPERDTRDYLEAHRENLLAQAKLLEAVPRWYLGPIVLGWSLMWVGMLVKNVESGKPLLGVFSYLAGCVVFFGGVYWLNRRGARQLRSKADALGGDLDAEE